MLISVKNAASLAFFCLTLPIYVLWRLLLSFFVHQERQKPWKRVAGDAAFRWFVCTQDIAFMQTIIGPSLRTYKKWCKQSAIRPEVEDIGHGAQIFWVGEKNCTKVILYLHGGGFSLPLADYSLSFWRFILQTMQETEGVKARLAILNYGLIPDTNYPTQLIQAVDAVNYLLSQGIKPEDMQLTGDSAGANLVNQLFLHMLHHVEGVPVVKAGTRFCGAYLMSPWVFLLPRSGVKSYTENCRHDLIPFTRKFENFGNAVVSGLPNRTADIKYVDAANVPEGWYDGVDKVVETVLITAGGVECLRDDIVEFAGVFCKAHPGAKLVVDKFGVHDDPFYDFLVGEKVHAELTPLIAQWLADRFTLEK